MTTHSRPARTPTRRPRLGFESLEAREIPAADITLAGLDPEPPTVPVPVETVMTCLVDDQANLPAEQIPAVQPRGSTRSCTCPRLRRGRLAPPGGAGRGTVLILSPVFDQGESGASQVLFSDDTWFAHRLKVIAPTVETGTLIPCRRHGERFIVPGSATSSWPGSAGRSARGCTANSSSPACPPQWSARSPPPW